VIRIMGRIVVAMLLPNNTTVDRPCDIHFIEAFSRKMPECLHCKEWDSVKKVVRRGVRVMNCPQPQCCPDDQAIAEKCCLHYGEFNE
jgi:hypothetical protein